MSEARRPGRPVARLCAVLIVLSLIYAFSYAPVLSLTMKPTPATEIDYPLMKTVIVPAPDPTWQSFYRPVKTLSDRSPLARAPLLWWAECWGVREWVEPAKPVTFYP